MNEFRWQIHRVQETGSTNDEARKLAAAGAPSGSVVVAEAQTAGRGRRGSVWISPPGRNLIGSFVWKPDFSMEAWPQLTHAIALAIALCLERLGLRPALKWPNDVYVSDRKVCGILLETCSAPSGMAAIIGFGLNVNLAAHEFPDDLQATATSLWIETERVWEREEILQLILAEFAVQAARLPQAFEALLADVESRSWLLGHRISLVCHEETRLGKVLGLTPQGGLRFLDDLEGEREILTADLIRRIESQR
jgi:BirA family transcriptional regulator, biotin operon repressor / biotin---[acetyl-CoA-carboxylase] ligase